MPARSSMSTRSAHTTHNPLSALHIPHASQQDSPEQKLKDLHKHLAHLKKTTLGYPNNNAIDSNKVISQFLDLHANNVGDPFLESSILMNTLDVEREVLGFFADLYKIPRNDFWGYTTSGGTEGNMHGIFLAREIYPNGILYFSEDTHYSIMKIARILRMPYYVVRSLDTGAIDMQDLYLKMQYNLDKPVIINANIGTTMKGAIDNVDEIIQMLSQLQVAQYHIHCDAALFGMIVPFLQNAPFVDFTKPIGSVAISGHKFIGSPVPCGVALTRLRNIQAIAHKVDYIESYDTTILGSRSAITPLIFWYAIQKRGYSGFRNEALEMVKKATYVYNSLRKVEYPCYLNPHSNTVFFKTPAENILHKYSLATHKEISHIVIMQSTTKQLLDEFLKDMFDGHLGHLIFKDK